MIQIEIGTLSLLGSSASGDGDPAMIASLDAAFADATVGRETVVDLSAFIATPRNALLRFEADQGRMESDDRTLRWTPIQSGANIIQISTFDSSGRGVVFDAAVTVRPATATLKVVDAVDGGGVWLRIDPAAIDPGVTHAEFAVDGGPPAALPLHAAGEAIHVPLGGGERTLRTRLLCGATAGDWSAAAALTPTAASLGRISAWSDAPTPALPVAGKPIAVAPTLTALARPPLVITPPTPRVVETGAVTSIDLASAVTCPVGSTLTWSAAGGSDGFAGSGLSISSAGLIAGTPVFANETWTDPELPGLTAERGRTFRALVTAADGVRSSEVAVEIERQTLVTPEAQVGWPGTYTTQDVRAQLQAALDAARASGATVALAAGRTYCCDGMLGIGTQRLYFAPGASILFRMGDSFVRAGGRRGYNPDAGANAVPFSNGWGARFEGALYTIGADDHPRLIGDVRMRLERTDTHGGALANLGGVMAVMSGAQTPVTIATMMADVLARCEAIRLDTATSEATRRARIKAVSDAAVGYFRDHFIFPKNVIRPTHPLTADPMRLEAHAATPVSWMSEYAGTRPPLIGGEPAPDVVVTSSDYDLTQPCAHRVRQHGVKAGCFFGGNGLRGVIRGLHYRVTRDTGGAMEQKHKESFFLMCDGGTIGPLRLGPVKGYSENDDEMCSVYHNKNTGAFENCRFESFDLTAAAISRGFCMTVFSNGGAAKPAVSQWVNTRFGPVTMRIEGGARAFAFSRIKYVPGVADGGPIFDGPWSIAKVGRIDIDPGLSGGYTGLIYDALTTGLTAHVRLPGLRITADGSGFIDNGRARRVIGGPLETDTPVYIYGETGHGFGAGWVANVSQRTPTPQITLPPLTTGIAVGAADPAAPTPYVSPWPTAWSLGEWVFPSEGGRVRYDVDGATATRVFDPEGDFALEPLAQAPATHWIAAQELDAATHVSLVDQSNAGVWLEGPSGSWTKPAGQSSTLRFWITPTDGPRLVAGQVYSVQARVTRSAGEINARIFPEPADPAQAVKVSMTDQLVTWTLTAPDKPARIDFLPSSTFAGQIRALRIAGSLAIPVTTLVTGIADGVRTS